MTRCVAAVLGFALGVGLGACGPGAETADDCMSDETFIAPGCSPPGDAVEVERGCYTPCMDDSDCGADQGCVRVYHDPCFQQVCHACGGSTDVCLASTLGFETI